jgi:hypothetical protein
MRINVDWLRDFPTTQALAFAAGVLIVAMCVQSMIRWDNPPEGLAIFLGSLAGISVAQFAVKRTTDHQYVQAKSDRAVAVATARASGAQPTRVTTTTQPKGTTVTEVESPAVEDDVPSMRGGE